MSSSPEVFVAVIVPLLVDILDVVNKLRHVQTLHHTINALE